MCSSVRQRSGGGGPGAAAANMAEGGARQPTSDTSTAEVKGLPLNP